MKKIFLAVFAAAILMLVSCNDKGRQNGAQGDVEVSLDSLGNVKSDTVVYVDSFVGKLFKFRYALMIEMPVGSDDIHDSIVKWVANEYDPEHLYKGDRMRLDSLFLVRAAHMKKDVKDTEEEFVSDDEHPDFGDGYDSTSIVKIWENREFVTYGYSCEYYFPRAAHGSYVFYAATFNKHDGSRIKTEDMFTDKAKLLSYIKRGLMDYFEARSIEELYDNLQLSDTKDVPLPQFGLWIEEGKVVFQYQQYEIACYAAGLPGGSIDLKLLSPDMVTPWFKDNFCPWLNDASSANKNGLQ